jgi:hypothetical protein
VLWPPRGGDPTAGAIGHDEWRLPPGQTYYVGEDQHTPLDLTIRHDQQTSRYTLKVLACTLPPEAPAPDLTSLAVDKTVQEVVGEATRDVKRDVVMEDEPTPIVWSSWDLVVRVARS